MTKPIKKVRKKIPWRWDTYDQETWWNEYAKLAVKVEELKRSHSAIQSPEQKQKELEQKKADIASVWHLMSDYGRSMTPPELVPEGEEIQLINEDPFEGSLLQGAFVEEAPRKERKVKSKGKD